MSARHTTLITVTDQGELELSTDDPAVIHKARQAKANQKVISFVYWAGENEEIVNGRVTRVSEGMQFRFSVLAEEAGEGP